MTETTPPPLRTAIIGYGESGRLSHAYGLQANPAFEIVAACDFSPDNRERAAHELDCPVYPDHRAMLEAEALDLVSVVTRSDTHAAIVCDCLEAGAHAVVTKPWALDQNEAEAMMRTEAATGRRIFPWIPMYWSPDFRALQGLLAEDAIGEVFLIRRYYSDFRRREDWQTERRFGGGYLLNWGMHIIQPVLALAGSPPRRVYGQLQQAINPGDAEDNFMAVVEFENGVRGVAEFTESLFPLPAFLLQGTRGTILVENEHITVRTQDPSDASTAQTRVIRLEGKQFGDEAEIYRDIGRSLREDGPFLTPSRLAWEGTRVLDAVRRSHETQSVVTLS
ncbi:MAG: Gfo/Idh/MocA family protein [Opitutales bacterium]